MFTKSNVQFVKSWRSRYVVQKIGKYAASSETHHKAVDDVKDLAIYISLDATTTKLFSVPDQKLDARRSNAMSRNKLSCRLKLSTTS